MRRSHWREGPQDTQAWAILASRRVEVTATDVIPTRALCVGPDDGGGHVPEGMETSQGVEQSGLWQWGLLLREMDAVPGVQGGMT